jgi:hypothetical protein
MAGTRRKPGRMGPFIDGFQARLLELGHTPETVRNALKVVGQLGRWMADTDVEVSELNEASIGAFISSRRARGKGRVPGARSFEPLLDYLRSQGVLTPAPRPSTPLEDLMASYRTWLFVERGLAAPTVLRYEKLARRFLEERAREEGDRFIDDLTGAQVIAFLLRETPGSAWVRPRAAWPSCGRFCGFCM